MVKEFDILDEIMFYLEQEALKRIIKEEFDREEE